MDPFTKSQTVDPEVRAYISSLVTAVGGQSTIDARYEIGDSAVAVLNDILRWVRLYDDKTDRYDVKRCLADSNVVKGDLLQILALWTEEEQAGKGTAAKWKAKLALLCWNLVVTLTNPMEVSEEKTKVNHIRHMPVLQLAQVGYKRAILHNEDAKILRTVVRLVLPAMAVERRERSRRDENIIKMILYGFRNIVMITQPQHLPSQGDENEVSRSATIDAFWEQGVFDLLLAVGSGANDEFQEHDVVVLETLFHLLKGVDAKKLFMEEKHLATTEVNELQSLMQRERTMLNDQKKYAPTRHNRFGTMVSVQRDDNRRSTVTGQDIITDAANTLNRMDASKKYNRPKVRGKQEVELNESADFGGRVDLTASARKHLSSFVADFLDSSFNPLFSNLRKAMERDVERMAPSNHRQFWYLISWFLAAEAARRDQKRALDPDSMETDENRFAHIAAVLDQETFVLLNRHMQRAFDEKVWQDLRSNMSCFTQILLTVQSMSESPDEEDQEIAENIQNRIFYEETTHDRIVQICRSYGNQGLGYLDAVTECVHVFVRMLETYSKQNVDLQIRSKRRARRKKKQARPQGEDGQDDFTNDDLADAENDEQEAHLTVRERNFDFARFSSKFLSQGCVDTFVTLTRFYTDLTPEQLKRCHRFFYRLAFKNELAVLVFRVDILLLFQRMIKGPYGLDSTADGYKEWKTLIQQIFRRCFRWLDRQQKDESEGKGWKEAAVIEMLFSKINATMFYLQNGYERVIEKRAPRAPAELQVKASVTEQDKRVAVAVSLLIDQGKQDLVEWLKRELDTAMCERHAWLELRKIEHPDDSDSALSPPSIFIVPLDAEHKEALFKDKFLRLLLSTLGLERLGDADDPDAHWTFPSELTVTDIKKMIDHIKKAEFDPPTFEDGKNALDMVRNKSSATSERPERPAFSDAESAHSDDEDISAFPPNLRQKRTEGAEPATKKRRLTRRNHTELTEEQLKEREANRKKKEKERNSKIKSALFITDSDDETDEEADREFFRLEDERRNKTANKIRKTILAQSDSSGDEIVSSKKAAKKAKSGGKAKEKSSKKKRPMASDESDDGAMDLDDSDAGSLQSARSDAAATRPPKRIRMSLFSDDDDEDAPSSSAPSANRPVRDEHADDAMSDIADAEEETPSTSPPATQASKQDLPLTEVSGNVSGGKSLLAAQSDDEDEDDGPVLKSTFARRNVRAGFIVDDDKSD